MKRIVWAAVAILICMAILGYGMYTLRHISEVNRRRRESNAGKIEASQIVMTTATTSVWDYLRAQETTTYTGETGEDGLPIEGSAPIEGGEPITPVETAEDGTPLETVPSEEGDVSLPEAETAAPAAQTVTETIAPIQVIVN
ncbi:MAG: hypothetical protein IKI21_08090 [Oscillospiraceae bacterium]|nr:hypothetical protein [Oscillospiraceae bacterium]